MAIAPTRRTRPEGDPHQRLLEAVAACVTERGFARTTIADIARRAQTSKRTFYEHFPDKEACFLAAYAAHSERMLERIANAALAEPDVEARLDAAIRVYLGALHERADQTRAFLIEIQAAGPNALQLRRAIQGRFAELLRVLVDAGRAQHPELAQLSPAMANAVVGGINELLLITVERSGVRALDEVGTTARALIRAVLLAPPSEPPAWRTP
jgi:AcrR family transcriptional regulator